MQGRVRGTPGARARSGGRRCTVGLKFADEVSPDFLGMAQQRVKLGLTIDTTRLEGQLLYRVTEGPELAIRSLLEAQQLIEVHIGANGQKAGDCAQAALGPEVLRLGPNKQGLSTGKIREERQIAGLGWSKQTPVATE